MRASLTSPTAANLCWFEFGSGLVSTGAALAVDSGVVPALLALIDNTLSLAEGSTDEQFPHAALVIDILHPALALSTLLEATILLNDGCAAPPASAALQQAMAAVAAELRPTETGEGADGTNRAVSVLMRARARLLGIHPAVYEHHTALHTVCRALMTVVKCQAPGTKHDAALLQALIDVVRPAGCAGALCGDQGVCANTCLVCDDERRRLVRCAAAPCGVRWDSRGPLADFADRSLLSVCSKCRTVAYCSSSCQRAHWPRHRSACRQAA